MSENIEKILSEVRTQIIENDYEISIGFLDQGKSRFLIQPAIEKLLTDDKGRIFSGLKINYDYGISLYEKDPERFSKWYKNPHQCGIASARDYLCYETTKKFLDEMIVGVTYLDDETEYSTLGTSNKFSRRNKEAEKNRLIESQKVAEFCKGYDQRRRDEQKERENKPKNKGRLGFLGWFFGEA